MKETISGVVLLNDVTLREGVQVARKPIGPADKAAIGAILAGAGVAQLQVGYPGRADLDRQTIALLKANGCAAVLEGMCSLGGDAWSREIDSAVESGADRLVLIFPTAEYRLRDVLHISRRQCLEGIASGVAHAVGHGIPVAFAPVEASRTDEGFLAEVLTVSAEAGADRFYLVDTVGVLYPARTSQLAVGLRKAGGLPLAIHAHNDLGCALANSLAAVEAGVSVVDVSVAGLGKRAGNAALEQMALALKLAFGQDCGIRLEELYDVVRRVMEILGIPVPAAQPLIGDGAFDFEVDSALRGSTAHTVVSGIPPEMVGYPRQAGRPRIAT